MYFVSIIGFEVRVWCKPGLWRASAVWSHQIRESSWISLSCPLKQESQYLGHTVTIWIKHAAWQLTSSQHTLAPLPSLQHKGSLRPASPSWVPPKEFSIWDARRTFHSDNKPKLLKFLVSDGHNLPLNQSWLALSGTFWSHFSWVIPCWSHQVWL